MARKERRVKELAERKRRKKLGGAAGSEDYAWMAGLLPRGGVAGAACVLEVGTSRDGTAALTERGWRVVPAETGAVLAQGEFTGEPVDAVTCWLLDLRAARPEVVEKLRAMGLRTPEEHRLAVQTLVYRLADRVLRPGGVLQVVDRMLEPFGESLATGMMRLQRAQAKGTRLEFASIDARPDQGGALVSVRSRKSDA
ncbi:MAG TPA: hypothetical protein VGL81_29875 [Polyangiaceae bacterium]|jgi:hypothetical protein